MVTASIEVSGPARDVHSGNDGGVFSEPMADLFKLLSSLTDAPADAARRADGAAPAGAAANPSAGDGLRGRANGAAPRERRAGSPGSDASSDSGGSAVSISSGRVSPSPGAGGTTLKSATAAARGADADADAGCGCEDEDGGGGMGTAIAIPGFYDGVRPRLIDLAWRGLEECDEFKLDSYQ
ncbi:hypothetical protein MNEG_16412 [Monoraphidium neglectum]|uniref:Uncharacterized protein n=1 Tax=Monoraphidium neglectum TaxID=145388 RepID=A0A0D2IUC9_9CHLO|nr:hypothetical protein MNEG_16412 [Monoraphidium neglectum]KIY91552.1 hypothetical protein MNEG_16412 [Monoraphidium neglectum]|eukprot:XP_013890572.1 hypothetical protein MNEG_16412 [Monoraphidium neglectum]